jgi:hypothetical protein
VLAKITGTNADAVFTRTLATGHVWTVATLLFDGALWTITPSSVALDTVVGCPADVGSTSCVCGNALVSPDDPYCGSLGAACRQRYP